MSPESHEPDVSPETRGDDDWPASAEREHDQPDPSLPDEPDPEAVETAEGFERPLTAEEEESRRISAWLADRAGRVRQSAGELRQMLAGEAAANAAIESVRHRVPEDPTGQHTDLTAAAFFDVDNTLVHGASIVLFARGLAARKYFSYNDIMKFAWQQAKFRITGREDMDDVAEGRDKALSFIAGRPTAELVAMGLEQLELLVKRPPEDARSAFELAVQHYAYCPALMDNLAPAMGAAYALAVHGVALSGTEAGWFTAEMLRGAGAVARAADGVALADVRMASFDALLQGEGA